MLEDVSDRGRSLAELLSSSQFRLVNAYGCLQLITALAPFCDPMLAIVRDDLESALGAIGTARALELEITAQLSGVGQGWRRQVTES